MSLQMSFFESDGTNMLISSRRKADRHVATGGCEQCGLYKTCNSPKMEATGEGRKGIFVLAEAPGANEDEEGVQLIGQSGKRLRKELKRFGIDLDKDCRKMNAVNCRPPKNKTPTDIQVALCRPRVAAEIQSFKPSVILALGGPAMKSLCQHREIWGKAGFPSMGTWEGEVIPDQELQAWVIPTWHPAFMERLGRGQKPDQRLPIFERRWRKSLRAVADMAVAGPPDIIDYKSCVQVVPDTDKASKKLAWLYKHLLTLPDPFVVFDYEGTGVKPYMKGHKLVSCSMTWNFHGQLKSISFLLDEKTWFWVHKILTDPRIKKGAHNIKFEEVWTRIRGNPTKGGFSVENWHWDSMLGAYVLDNRTGRAGLKFQAYVKYGVLGYDVEIHDYLKSDQNGKFGKNAINNIHLAPVDKLLLYGGMDGVFTYNLAMDQQAEIAEDEGLTEAYELWHEGSLALADIEINGIVTDRAYCQKQAIHLKKRVKHIRTRALEYPEVQLWKKNEGDKFNLNSKPQLSKLLFETLGYESTKKTDKGNASVEKDVLEDLDLRFLQDLVVASKLEKLNTTYIGGFLRESPDGILHPTYNLVTTVSGRGSANDPNFQNIPKRDSEANRITRKALLPPPGCLWWEADFSGVEVSIATTYHKDPTMIEYLFDKTSDMHRDMACQLMFLDAKQVSKYLRNAAKNGFVFAQFYGDWYVACAANMWKKWFKSKDAKLADGTHIYDHLRKFKIRSLEDFEHHVRKVEKHFWNKRFPVYAQWRKDNWEKYRKTGVMRGHTGFRYTAIMDPKQTSNYGTQGSGFHCLVRSMIAINKELKGAIWDSYLIGQIHDALDGCTIPSEVNALFELLRKIMIVDLKERYKWINVPIEIELELAPIGKSWHELKEVNKRPVCSCGLEWGYRKSLDDGGTRWTCPVCDDVKIERKKAA